MSARAIVLVACGTFGCFVAPARAAPVHGMVSAGALQKILRNAVGWKLTPGISLAVVANGKIVFAGADRKRRPSKKHAGDT